MKTHRFALLATTFATTAFATSGCAKEPDASVPVAATAPAAPAPAAPAPVAPAPVTPEAAPPAPVPAADWLNLKDFTHDRRAELLAGLPGLEARVDEEISELQARRAALPAKTDTNDWDFAMKEMGEARGYLRSVNEEMTKASRETWDQQKEKVDLAWIRSQDAYAKVKTSTTLR